MTAPLLSSPAGLDAAHRAVDAHTHYVGCSPNTPEYDMRQLLLLGHFAFLNGGSPVDFRILHPGATVQDTYDETVAALGFDPLVERDGRVAA